MRRCQYCGKKELSCFRIISGLCPDCYMIYDSLKAIIDSHRKKNVFVTNEEDDKIIENAL